MAAEAAPPPVTETWGTVGRVMSSRQYLATRSRSLHVLCERVNVNETSPCSSTHLICPPSSGKGGQLPLFPRWWGFPGGGAHAVLRLYLLFINTHLPEFLLWPEVRGQRGGGVARESIQDQLWLLLLFLLQMKALWKDGGLAETLKHRRQHSETKLQRSDRVIKTEMTTGSPAASNFTSELRFTMSEECSASNVS